MTCTHLDKEQKLLEKVSFVYQEEGVKTIFSQIKETKNWDQYEEVMQILHDLFLSMLLLGPRLQNKQ
jgi:hypothetical protein